MMTLGKGVFWTNSCVVMIDLLLLVLAFDFLLDFGTQLPTFNTRSVRKIRHCLDEG